MKELIAKAQKLENELLASINDEEKYRSLMAEYEFCISELKKTSGWTFEHALELQEEVSVIENKLPRVTDSQFDRYTHLITLLGVLLE